MSQERVRIGREIATPRKETLEPREMLYVPIEGIHMSEPGLPGGGREDDIWNTKAKGSGRWQKDPRKDNEEERHHNRNQEGIIVALGSLGALIVFTTPDSSWYNAALAGLLKGTLAPFAGGFCAARIGSALKSPYPISAIAGGMLNGVTAVNGFMRAASAAVVFGLPGLASLGLFGVGFMIGDIKKKDRT